MSEDHRYALLVRSSNTVPDELVRADLVEKTVIAIASPNRAFTERKQGDVRFYHVGAPDSGLWGRLYLPPSYLPGKLYPLVITNYISSPGFYASVGDEVPILALTASDIAVFAMHDANLNKVSQNGDIRMEIARLQRPLDGIDWIIGRLSAEGIIDPERVGMSGLSYGAEIAMYAYWKSNRFRAFSVASAGLDPSIHSILGPSFSRWWISRGLPWPDETGIRAWRSVAAGPNARAGLPPLLIQSGEKEEALTAPTWTELRGAGAQVDWIEYPNEGHEKISPATKWWVYQRNLDWFRFWLQGYVDPGPSMREDYRKWRSM